MIVCRAVQLTVRIDLNVVQLENPSIVKICCNTQIVMIEEAVEVLESHVITSLAPTTEHLILIGASFPKRVRHVPVMMMSSLLKE